MSSPRLDGAPADPRGRPALRRLVPVGDQAFAEDHWGRAPLASSAGSLPRDFDDLFSEDAVDELVSERGLRTPFLRVAKNGRTLGSHEFTAPGGTGAGIGDQVSDDRLLSLFAGGATMVLQGLHRTWGPLIGFCQQLAADLGHPVQANAYVTPPQNQGFDDHYDVHDVFVLQVAGEKQWRIRPPVLDAPLRDQTWDQRRAAVRSAAELDPLLEITLKPGDCLYLPRGFLHSATALGGTSTHLTLGVHTWTRHTVAEVVAEQVLASLRDDETLRASLPFGVDVSDPSDLTTAVEMVTAALTRQLGEVSVDDVAATLRRQRGATQRAAPVHPLRQLRDAQTLTAGDRIALRAHLDAGLEQDGTDLQLRSRAGSTVVGPQDQATVETLLHAGALTLTADQVDLARRLVNQGLAVHLDEKDLGG